MGNTPSQGGFHLPDNKTRTDMLPHSLPNNLGQTQSVTAIQNLNTCPLQNINSAKSAENLLLGQNLEGSMIQFADEALEATAVEINRTDIFSDQPYSMDSLALDVTSNINREDFSPSSLSPILKNSLSTLAPDNIQFELHNTSNTQEEHNYLPNCRKYNESNEMKDSISNHYDSLDEPISNLITKNFTPPSSSITLDPLNNKPEEEEIITVNGLEVTPVVVSKSYESSVIMKTCESSHKLDAEKSDKSDLGDRSHNNSPSSSGFISEPETSICNIANNQSNKPWLGEDVIVEKQNAINQPMHINNQEDLCSAPVIECEVHQVQPSDLDKIHHPTTHLHHTQNFHTFTNNLANSSVQLENTIPNISVMEISERPEANNMNKQNEKFTHTFNADDSTNFRIDGTKISTNFTTKKTQESHVSSSHTNNMPNRQGDHPSITIHNTHNPPSEGNLLGKRDDFQENLIISKLIFVSGENGEDGQLYSHISLQSRDDESDCNIYESEDSTNCITNERNKLSHQINTLLQESNEKIEKQRCAVNEEIKEFFNHKSSQLPKDNQNENFNSPQISIQEIKSKLAESEFNLSKSNYSDLLKKSESDKKSRKGMMEWESLDEFEALEAESLVLTTPNLDTNNSEKIVENSTLPFVNSLNPSYSDTFKTNELPFDFGQSNANNHTVINSIKGEKSQIDINPPPPPVVFECTKVALVDEIFITEIEKMNRNLNESQGNSLDASVHSAQDREIQEESINFHREASPNRQQQAMKMMEHFQSVQSENKVLLNPQHSSNKESYKERKYDGKANANNDLISQSMNLSSHSQSKVLINSYDQMETTTVQTVPTKENVNTYSRNKETIMDTITVNPSILQDNLHKVNINTISNNTVSPLTEEISCSNAIETPQCEKVQHISKIYMSSEPLGSSSSQSEVLSDNLNRNLNQSENKDAVNANILKIEPISVSDKDIFFIEIDGFEKANSQKKICKPPRLSSNYRKPTKSSGLQESASSSSVNNSCSSSQSVTSDTFAESFETVANKTDYINNNKCSIDRKDLNRTKRIAPNTVIFETDNSSRVFPQTGVCSPIKNSTRAENCEDLKSILKLNTNPKGPEQLLNPKLTMVKSGKGGSKEARPIYHMSSDSGSSISSAECSIVFLPSPTDSNKTVGEAIIQEISRKQATKISENENNISNFISSKNVSLGNSDKPLGKDKANTTFPFTNRSQDLNINSEDCSNDLKVKPKESFKVRHFETSGTFVKVKPPVTTSELVDIGKIETENCSNDLTGVCDKIMSPSLSNNLIEMNGIDSHNEDEQETLSLQQEDNFSKQLQEKENYINELQNTLESMKTKATNEPNYTRVLAEYEKTLSMYIQKVDDMKQKLGQADEEKLLLIQERDQALEDLRNVESAFSDVHRKYERSKTMLENLKENEQTLLRRDQELVQRIVIRDKKIDTLKEKVQESLENMHMDYENKIRDLESENVRLRAQFRKMEMKVDSLENDVEQKAKENAQLSALCDELINGKVSN